MCAYQRELSKTLGPGALLVGIIWISLDWRSVTMTIELKGRQIHQKYCFGRMNYISHLQLNEQIHFVMSHGHTDTDILHGLRCSISLILSSSFTQISWVKCASQTHSLLMFQFWFKMCCKLLLHLISF